jgi:hypothetical protein
MQVTGTSALGYPPGPCGRLLWVSAAALRLLLCLSAEGRARLHLPEHAGLNLH